MIKLGSNNIGKIYLGSNSIGKAYLGSNLVYQKGGGGDAPVYHKYLVFDGLSELATSVVFPQNGSLLVNFGNETSKVAQGVFTSGDETNGCIRMFYGGSTTTTKRTIVVYYDSTSYSGYQDLNFSNTEYSFYMTPNGWGFGNAYYTYTKGNSHPNSGIVFGEYVNGQRYTGTIETVKIYGSDAQSVNSYSGFSSYTPVATLRPCTYLGEAGLWHVESGMFYGKTDGSGSLSVDD